MHIVAAPSVDCRFSEPPPAFSCRPCPTTRKPSSGLQRKSHIRAATDLMAWRHSLRPRARLIVVIAHSMCDDCGIDVLRIEGERTDPGASSIHRPRCQLHRGSVRSLYRAGALVRAIIQIESAGDAHAISSRGAMGWMQLMPATWIELSVRYELGLDPFDPRDNIMAGTAYVRELSDRFGSAGRLPSGLPRRSDAVCTALNGRPAASTRNHSLRRRGDAIAR